MRYLLIVLVAFTVLIFPSIIGAQITFERWYGGTFTDWGNSVQETQGGGYIIAGVTESFGAGWEDVYLIKTDSVGDTVWTKTYGGTEYECGNSVQETQDGGYIIAGVTESFGADSGDIYLIKTDSLGDTVWTKTYGGTDDERGYSVQETQDGGYIIAGIISFGPGGGDVYLIKTDAIGDTVWTKTYGSTDADCGFSVQETQDAGYIIAGGTWSFGTGYSDVYLIKTDGAGNVGIEEAEEREEKREERRLFAHPNPFTEKTVISYQLSVIGYDSQLITDYRLPITLSIYDVSGRLVKSAPLTTNHLSLGTDLTPGIYFLKLNGKPVGKVVKVR